MNEDDEKRKKKCNGEKRKSKQEELLTYWRRGFLVSPPTHLSFTMNHSLSFFSPNHLKSVAFCLCSSATTRTPTMLKKKKKEIILILIYSTPEVGSRHADSAVLTCKRSKHNQIGGCGWF